MKKVMVLMLGLGLGLVVSVNAVNRSSMRRRVIGSPIII
jgi:hypothetical protein